MENMARRQTGFAAIAAIFLVVVLAALGSFMLTFSNTQQLTATQDLQGTRAFWAARAGLEWGVAKVGSVTSAASVAACAAFPKATPQTLPGSTATFDGSFKAEVYCEPSSYAEGSATVNIYKITATATPSGGVATGSIAYVERSLTAIVEM